MIVRITTGCVFTGVYDREHAYQSWSIEDQCQDSYTETEGRVSRGLKKDPPPFQLPLEIQPTHETRFMVMDFSSGNEPSLFDRLWDSAHEIFADLNTKLCYCSHFGSSHLS